MDGTTIPVPLSYHKTLTFPLLTSLCVCYILKFICPYWVDNQAHTIKIKDYKRKYTE